ncbi:multiprotein-bridging factor 1 [Malassezia pachydermatis]|uniref:Mbf1-multiprotein bridging factor mediates gcn4-dependent transcriptional activation n=1 Tax=Malassezia pachydermatis TaxID=77020 RepID=A0A0M9VRE6_9BASI|nr:mbf1-multiprotein bridging factor mediates gcn4-dependent transcriptional activation [Malassezia pachydermatis]KOS16533.1 mbf1-multiprotein bridging factor mediates gcn4-dependent transcriptional activation [Malassezia pachydermatis]
MSAWDQTVVIGRKARPSGSGTSAPRGPTALERAKQVGAVTANDRKIAAGHNKGHQGTDHQRIAKLDREDDVAPPSKVPPTVGKAIGQTRQAKGMTQKDLAVKINEKPSVIQDYESGKAIPNPQILGKMERILGVKLRGKDIGAPLGGPKKS